MATEFRPSFAGVGRNAPKCHCTKDFERKESEPVPLGQNPARGGRPARRDAAVMLSSKSLPAGWPALKEQRGADGAQKPRQQKGCHQPRAA